MKKLAVFSFSVHISNMKSIWISITVNEMLVSFVLVSDSHVLSLSKNKNSPINCV